MQLFYSSVNGLLKAYGAKCLIRTGLVLRVIKFEDNVINQYFTK